MTACRYYESGGVSRFYDSKTENDNPKCCLFNVNDPFCSGNLNVCPNINDFQVQSLINEHVRRLRFEISQYQKRLRELSELEDMLII
jgi:hypothetical protein